MDCAIAPVNNFSDELGFAADFFKLKTRASEFNVAHGWWNGRVTSHVSLGEVAPLITRQRVNEAIMLADQTLKRTGYDNPRIAVAALNPHAGDGGLLGREEIEVLQPTVDSLQKQGINVQGPFPSDTIWLRVRDGEFDSVITMYHDQGQIAIKLLGFDRGVSVLAGLPVGVTTPAHGTAFDIAGKNKANLVPSKNAFMMVADMAERDMAASASVAA